MPRYGEGMSETQVPSGTLWSVVMLVLALGALAVALYYLYRNRKR